MTIELDIARLGAQGDGIAETSNGPRYVPFALPGERVRLAGKRHARRRFACQQRPCGAGLPSLRHCGGCVAQHMSDRLYADWKRSIVVDAFRHHGLQAEIAPLRRIALGSRRRAVLTARQEAGGSVTLGYHRRKSTDLVDIEECPILEPAIVARLGALRSIAAAMPGRDIRLTVLLTHGGLDVSVNHDAPPTSARMQLLDWPRLPPHTASPASPSMEKR